MHEFLEQQMHVLDEMTEFRIPPYKSLKQWTMVHSKDDPKLSYQIIVPTLRTPRGGGGDYSFGSVGVGLPIVWFIFTPFNFGEGGSQRFLSPDSPVVVQNQLSFSFRWKERRRTVV